MLPRQYRLSGKRKIEQVKKTGRLFQSGSFALLVLARKDEDCSKFGLIVSKKIAKKASERNRIKRGIRQVASRLVLRVKAGYDLLLLTKLPIRTIKPDALQDELEKLLLKLDLI